MVIGFGFRFLLQDEQLPAAQAGCLRQPPSTAAELAIFSPPILSECGQQQLTPSTASGESVAAQVHLLAGASCDSLRSSAEVH